jgi:hypothetical protein
MTPFSLSLLNGILLLYKYTGGLPERAWVGQRTGTCLPCVMNDDQTTEHTELQRPFSGVHSIMMEKLAQAGEGVGLAHSSNPPPFTIPTITYKVVLNAPD